MSCFVISSPDKRTITVFKKYINGWKAKTDKKPLQPVYYFGPNYRPKIGSANKSTKVMYSI
jgi:hypothetical protein